MQNQKQNNKGEEINTMQKNIFEHTREKYEKVTFICVVPSNLSKALKRAPCPKLVVV